MKLAAIVPGGLAALFPGEVISMTKPHDLQGSSSHSTRLTRFNVQPPPPAPLCSPAPGLCYAAPVQLRPGAAPAAAETRYPMISRLQSGQRKNPVGVFGLCGERRSRAREKADAHAPKQ